MMYHISRKFRWPIRLLAAVGLVTPLALVASPAGADVTGANHWFTIFTPSTCGYMPYIDTPGWTGDPILHAPSAATPKTSSPHADGTVSTWGEFTTCVDNGLGIIRGELTSYNGHWPGQYAQGPVPGRYHLQLTFNNATISNSPEEVNPVWNFQFDTPWVTWHGHGRYCTTVWNHVMLRSGKIGFVATNLSTCENI